MTSSSHGEHTSPVEVVGITDDGIRLRCGNDREFLAFEDFPWFRGESEDRIKNVRQLSAGHYYWPDLDIDLSLEIIRHPARFPLKAH